MKRSIVPGILLFLIAMVSGCIFSSDDPKEEKKGTIQGKVTMIFTGEPVANVKVMLVNKNAELDTTTGANNRAAFVDSALTDAEGEYVIDNIPPGNYGVAPIPSDADTAAVYRFTPAQDAGSYEFVMNGETRTVNFIAESQSYPGADNDSIRLRVTLLIDIPYYISNVTWERRAVLAGASIFKTPVDCGQVTEFLIEEPLGFMGDLYSEDNLFRINLIYQSDVDFTERERSFFVGFAFRTPLLDSSWEYNVMTGRLVGPK